MNILALDLGTATGWAYGVITDNMPHIVSGCCKLPKEGGARASAFIAFLNQQGKAADVIYYEKVEAHKGTYAAHCYGGFQALLQLWAHQEQKPLVPVGVKTIKKFVAGTGNANKAMMLQAVNSIGYITTDDNEADAIALCLYAVAKIRKH